MTIVFLVLRLGPLDPAEVILGDYGTEEALRNLRETMGLDKPVYVQYLTFLNDLIHGSFGRSYLNKQPVLSQLLAVLPYTLELVFAAVLAGILFGVPPGIISAIKCNTIFDQIFRGVTLVGISVPIFVVGIVFIVLFSLQLGLLPAIGGGDPGNLKSHIIHLILPALSCGVTLMASVGRLTRAALLDVLNKDYIVTARSKGLMESIVIGKHAMKNAVLSLITFLGIYVNMLLGSAVLTEVVFTRPGVGRLIVEGVKSSDFPIVQTCLMFYVGVVVIVNLLVDISYSVIDPRIVYR
jgi:ABC-type dipeptide/oligopeptide/nickel transport system permease component